MDKVIKKINKEEWFNEYFKDKNEKNEIIKKLISTTDYLDWVINFIDNTEELSNEENYLDSLIEIDKDNINKLDLFYRGIKNYAKENYIYPTKCYFGSYYKIKYNDIGFEVGLIEGQGTVTYFCSKTPIKKKREFVDFNDIMTNKKQKNVGEINDSLDSISDMIMKAYQKGVPLESIKEAVYKATNIIEDNNQKKLLRERKR